MIRLRKTTKKSNNEKGNKNVVVFVILLVEKPLIWSWLAFVAAVSDQQKPTEKMYLSGIYIF